jgi:hypothetical protein
MSTGVSGAAGPVPPDDLHPLWPDLTADPPEPFEPADKAAGPDEAADRAVAAAGTGSDDAPGSGLRGALGVVAVTNRRQVRPPPAPKRGRHTQPTRHPAVGLAGMLLCALLAAFVAWVSAEPVWLAVGHAEAGTVTVTKCTDGRCTGTFTGDGFTRTGVPVMGAAPAPGATAPARMTSVRGTRAYVDVDATARAATGLALLILCGLAIARVTGARRLPTPRTRVAATAASLAAPLILLAGMLATTF